MTSTTYQRKIQKQANFIALLLLLGCYGVSIALFIWQQTSMWYFVLGGTNIALFAFWAYGAKNVGAMRYWVGFSLAVALWLLHFQLSGTAGILFFLCALALIFYQDEYAFLSYSIATLGLQIMLYYQAFYQLQQTPTLLFLGGLQMGVMAFCLGLCAVIAYLLHSKNWNHYLAQQQAEERIKSLETSLDWIMHISEGELTHTNDQVLYGIAGGNRLIEMKNKLVQAKNLEEKEKFGNLGLAQIAELVSDHEYDMDDLAQKVLHQILVYFDAQQGTLYLLEQTDEGEKLVLKSAYACNPAKHNRDILDMNEGFVGQALQARMVLQMDNIPESFFHIETGLGNMKPRTVLAVPIQTNEDAVGVMEIALLNPIEPYKIELLEKIAENIASSILGIKFNNTTAHLLYESRELAARLQAQEANIREHLHDYEEQLATKEREIEELKKALAEKTT